MTRFCRLIGKLEGRARSRSGNVETSLDRRSHELKDVRGFGELGRPAPGALITRAHPVRSGRPPTAGRLNAFNPKWLRASRADPASGCSEVDPIVFPVARDASKQIGKAGNTFGPA